MSKKVAWVVVLISLVVLGLMGYYLNYSKSAQQTKSLSYGLMLKGLPSGVCPDKVKAIFVDKNEALVYDQTVRVDNCDKVTLNMTGVAQGAYKVYIKMNNALAFVVPATMPLDANIEYYPEIGDVNSDNIIDSQDEAFVLKYFNKIPALTDEYIVESDVDKDGYVSALDLTYIRKNMGVGRNHPQARDWSIL